MYFVAYFCDSPSTVIVEKPTLQHGEFLGHAGNYKKT